MNCPFIKSIYVSQDLTAYYENPGDTPILVNTDGSEEPMDLDEYSPNYLCIVVFRAALDPLSSSEMEAFSASVAAFSALDCQLVGVSRDSAQVVREWLLDLGEGAQFPCISCQVLYSNCTVKYCDALYLLCQNLGSGDYGLTQALGVPLVEGYPLPAIIITDR